MWVTWQTRPSSQFDLIQMWIINGWEGCQRDWNAETGRGLRWRGLMTKLRGLFPSGGPNIQRLQSQREWISVWTGFNLPSDNTRQARRRECFPSRHKSASAWALCCTSTWHAVRQLVPIKDRTETWSGRVHCWKTSLHNQQQKSKGILRPCSSRFVCFPLLESGTNGKLRCRRNVHPVCAPYFRLEAPRVYFSGERESTRWIMNANPTYNCDLHQRYWLQRTAYSARLLFTLNDLLS